MKKPKKAKAEKPAKKPNGKAAAPKADAAAAPADKPKRGRPPKQTKMPGMERQDRNDEIERAAVKYDEIKMERVALSAEEGKAKKELHDAMNRAGLKEYHCDTEAIDVLIVPSSEESVKTKRRKVAIDEDEDDGRARVVRDDNEGEDLDAGATVDDEAELDNEPTVEADDDVPPPPDEDVDIY